MNNKKLISLAMLCTLLGINNIQAYRDNYKPDLPSIGNPIADDRFFHVGEEEKPKKSKNKNGKKQGRVRAPYGDWASQLDRRPQDPVDLLPPLGQSSSTYAPKKFEPAQEFMGDGLVGNYFADSQTATIHDPSPKKSTNYSFENVIEITGLNEVDQAPQGLVKIGSFMTSAACPPGVMCITAMKVTTLFGKLKK